LALPVLIAAIVFWLAPQKLPSWANLILTLAIIAPMGSYLYTIAFRPIESASVLTLLIVAIGVHLAMTGLGLVFFGAEGLRSEPLSSASLNLGPLNISGQSMAVYALTFAAMLALSVFFNRTLAGKALRATAVNRVGARLVGVRTALAGTVAFSLAASIGALSGGLTAPMTTIYYDTGFLIGLKGFIAAIIGSLASYPITVAAAIGVGLVEAFASFFASQFKEVIVFTLIIPVLVWLSLTTHHVEEEE
ncbi:MAG: branched-chain amino acid ABC transporter permease, partial [Alphaproteobacteria bacterium]|nr:branched-chain amino acid ABC transporter permease [Alphaproteobacteria bacterium]